MATEIKHDQFVPQTLRVPPPVGSSPIWKLSLELLLNVAECLDIHTCLTLSQTCRTLYFLSLERTVFWRSANFAPGLLPRVAPRTSFSGLELRNTAVRSINLEWRWENTSPRLMRRTHVPILYGKEKYWLPSGTRWLFQYGADKQAQKLLLSVYDLVERRVVGVLELKPRVIRIEGESLAPNRVVFITHYDGPSTIPVHIVDFLPSKSKGNQIEAVFRKYRDIQLPGAVVRCTLQQGIVAVSTAEEIIVEGWEEPDNTIKRKAKVLADWEPRGLQVARDRLIFLERKRDREIMKTWRIRVFDISSVRRGTGKERIGINELNGSYKMPGVQGTYAIMGPSASVPAVVGIDGYQGETETLRCTGTGFLPHFPHEPFYAPYWEERREDDDIHLGFKTVIVMHTVEGEYLWHVDFNLDIPKDETEDDAAQKTPTKIQNHVPLPLPGQSLKQLNSKMGLTGAEREDRLTMETPCILGAETGDRATYFVDAHALSSSAGRVVWIASNGMARIFSAWTDEGANSRVLDLRCKPATIPRVLAFDEKLGALMLSDTDKNTAVFWFA